MTVQVTKKQISENFYCAAAGYCALQRLFSYKSPAFYTRGTYGWNFDAYTFECKGVNVCITTGYRGMIDNCAHNFTYNVGKAYEARAEKILTDYTPDAKGQLDSLVVEFIDEVFGDMIEGQRAKK